MQPPHKRQKGPPLQSLLIIVQPPMEVIAVKVKDDTAETSNKAESSHKAETVRKEVQEEEVQRRRGRFPSWSDADYDEDPAPAAAAKGDAHSGSSVEHCLDGRSPEYACNAAADIHTMLDDLAAVGERQLIAEVQSPAS